ncbi:MAG: hypothetical protein PUB97_00700 [Ruminococcus sp.]|nr:hypothetical protein [Ruminococcus sp.]
MEKASKELLKEFVNSQKFTSTTDNMLIRNMEKNAFAFVVDPKRDFYGWFFILYFSKNTRANF